MRLSKGFSILIISLLLTTAFKHPFYLSVTDLKYSDKQKTLQGSVKIFINDLEVSLRKIHNRPVDLINIKDTVSTEKILSDYIHKHLTISVNSKSLKYTTLGFEGSGEAIWVYLESEKCGFPAKIEFKNTILYEDLSQQMNIIHIEVNQNRQSSRLVNPDSQANFLF